MLFLQNNNCNSYKNTALRITMLALKMLCVNYENVLLINFVRQFTSLPVYQFLSLPVCQFASLQVCKFVSLSVCKFVSLPVCQFASLSGSQFASLQVCHFVSLFYSFKILLKLKIDFREEDIWVGRKGGGGYNVWSTLFRKTFQPKLIE